MLRVTRLTDYATLLMTVLAAAPHAVHSATALAERTYLELATVSKVLKALSHAGLLEGLRGVNGGYRLMRAPEDINLLDIVRAIEGPVEVTECSGEYSRCAHSPRCNVAAHWRQINGIFSDTLRRITLEQLLAPPSRISATPHIEMRLAT